MQRQLAVSIVAVPLARRCHAAQAARRIWRAHPSRRRSALRKTKHTRQQFKCTNATRACRTVRHNHSPGCAARFLGGACCVVSSSSLESPNTPTSSDESSPRLFLAIRYNIDHHEPSTTPRQQRTRRAHANRLTLRLAAAGCGCVSTTSSNISPKKSSSSLSSITFFDIAKVWFKVVRRCGWVSCGACASVSRVHVCCK